MNASANDQLDEILDLVVEGLQITPTQHSDAEAKYLAVSDWLSRADSPLNTLRPSIYAQGSLRIGTTVRPHRAQEFDLDLVCELQGLSGDSLSPTTVYDLLWTRMKDNGRYEGILERMPRCIRLNYANNFHLDIVPAVPDAVNVSGATKIPDRDLKTWLPSNPRGYATWFEARTTVRRRKVASEANIEPLRLQEAASDKPPLKLAVQLLKRWRDLAFENRTEARPTSIVLTTVAAMFYGAEPHVTDALSTILPNIVRWATIGNCDLDNPANPGENITDRWLNSPGALVAFREEISTLANKWQELERRGQFPSLGDELKELFGVGVGAAIKKYATRRMEARTSGRLYASRDTGMLVQTAGAASFSIPRHNFYGGTEK